MRIKLIWTNRSIAADGIAIYRTDSPVPNEQLTNPLAQLGGDVTTYTDNTAVMSKTYYYVIATTVGLNTSYSAPLKIIAQYDTGPGPATLTKGDSQLGYFGTCTAVEMFTRDELIAWGKFPTTSIDPTVLPLWDKWQRNGKILFIPRIAPVRNTTWLDLYNKGAVFGTDDTGPNIGSGQTTIQNARLTKGYHVFKIRLATGADDRNNPTRKFVAEQGPSLRQYSEVADLFYPRAASFFPIYQRWPRPQDTQTLSEFMADSAVPVICQESRSTNDTTILAAFGPTTSLATYVSINTLTWSLPGNWKPVLELDQTDLVIKEIIT